MKILGVNASHTATACLLVDGEIKACISEERLSRVKSQSGFPFSACKEVLRITKTDPSEIDYLVTSFRDPKVNSSFATLAGVRVEGIRDDGPDRGSGSLLDVLRKIGWKVKENLLVNVPASKHLYNNVIPLFYKFTVDGKLDSELLEKIEKELSIPRQKIKKADHHDAHAYSALFCSPSFNKKPLLVLTLDGMGDGLCSTVRTMQHGEIKIVSKTAAGNSLGDLYSFVTSYLGMKMGEHEYKVMGLAAYSKEEYVEDIYNKLKDLIWVNDDLTFETKIHSHMLYKVLPEIFQKKRFDNISGAVQLLTEDLLREWIKKAIKKTGIKNLACGGGVFMNVKANQRVLELPEVNEMFVMPSCGDESTAIGAAFYGYYKFGGKDLAVSPLSDLYLGNEYSDSEIELELKKVKSGKIGFRKFKNIEEEVAILLAQSKVVARFKGRMEFGARALGNRSILANPSNLDSVREINESIKSRDFWMPFAPSILESRQSDYFKNPKNNPASFMIMTFDSTKKGRDNLKAAMHQYDFTLRPQVVRSEINPSYYNLIGKFEKLTGIGGVLNTSFNLHGYPVVRSPKDALEVLEKSKLKYLAIGNFLVTKNEK